MAARWRGRGGTPGVRGGRRGGPGPGRGLRRAHRRLPARCSSATGPGPGCRGPRRLAGAWRRGDRGGGGRLDVPPGELLCWLGPAIGPDAFEVGDEVRASSSLSRDPGRRGLSARRRGRWLADLYALARAAGALGVRPVWGGGCAPTPTRALLLLPARRRHRAHGEPGLDRPRSYPGPLVTAMTISATRPGKGCRWPCPTPSPRVPEGSAPSNQGGTTRGRVEHADPGGGGPPRDRGEGDPRPVRGRLQPGRGLHDPPRGQLHHHDDGRAWAPRRS
jgi:hypothetical protein